MQTTFEDLLCLVSVLVEHTKYQEAAKAVQDATDFSKSQKDTLKQVINRNILFARSLEWNNHGISKTFRFWSKEEKYHYLSVVKDLIETLNSESDNVCLGFGAVLGHVRNLDLIDHDDDVDVLFAVQPAKFSDAKAQLRSLLEKNDFKVFGDNLSHFTACKKGSNCNGIDVFIAFIEDGHLSCFPSRRRSVPLPDVFPSNLQNLLGCELPFPASAQSYLEKVYGLQWKDPIANWNHPWDRQEYAEYI